MPYFEHEGFNSDLVGRNIPRFQPRQMRSYWLQCKSFSTDNYLVCISSDQYLKSLHWPLFGKAFWSVIVRQTDSIRHTLMYPPCRRLGRLSIDIALKTTSKISSLVLEYVPINNDTWKFLNTVNKTPWLCVIRVCIRIINATLHYECNEICVCGGVYRREVWSLCRHSTGLLRAFIQILGKDPTLL